MKMIIIKSKKIRAQIITIKIRIAIILMKVVLAKLMVNKIKKKEHNKDILRQKKTKLMMDLEMKDITKYSKMR